MQRFIVIISSILLLCGCGQGIHPKTFVNSCEFRRYPIDVPTPERRNGDAVEVLSGESSVDGIRRALEASRAAPAATGERPVDASLLFLSGGSLHGAFGAGLLDGWKAKDGHLPNFAVVTGVSTGAILSSFAFVDRPDIVARAYSIQKEGQLLNALVPVKDGAPTASGYISLVKKGAIGDLAPLRSYLAQTLDDEILNLVARGHRAQRILRVGVVDVDTAQAWAIDLGDMAQRWAGASDPLERARYKSCYVEAIVASSSAPLAALPVFIDDRMYMDGGARFGAFAQEFDQLMGVAGPDSGGRAPPVKPTVYLVINGDQTVTSRCARQDTTKCIRRDVDAPDDPPGGDPAGANAGEHGDWSLLKLALRSEQILVNQVYRFSADSIAFRSQSMGIPLHYAQIDPVAALDHVFQLDDDSLGHEQLTCREARRKDKAEFDPVQFYPRYMHCLVDYGRSRAQTPW